MGRKQVAYAPVLIDGEPTEQAYETNIPDSKLGLGGDPKQMFELGKDLKRHKKQLKWKEPKKEVQAKCALCGERMVKTHPTQKYCEKCAPKAKQIQTNIRVMRYRNKDAVNVRNPTGELILHAVYGIKVVKVHIPANYSMTIASTLSYIDEHFEGKTRDMLVLQALGFFRKEKLT